MKKSHSLSLVCLLAAFSAPSWAVPIVGSDDSVNNSAQLGYSVQNGLDLRLTLKNTSSYDARVTGFGFDLDGGSAYGLWSVSGTLDNDAGSPPTTRSPVGRPGRFAITGRTPGRQPERRHQGRRHRDRLWARSRAI
jgi:hypothetical protein